MAKLDGKVALVTGASKGIGAAAARALASDGAAVVVNYASSREGAEAVVAAITAAGGRAIAVQADVSKEAEVAALVEATVSHFGRLDILVNNSGVYEFAGIADVTEDLYRRIFDINVLGVLLTTKAAVPHLGEGASIINISSNITTLLVPESSVYSASKGAVDAITGVLARELGPRGIRVNAVLPGMTITEGSKAAGVIGSEFETAIVAQTPLGRLGRPEDVASVITFLASDDSAWLTGDKLFASGGLR